MGRRNCFAALRQNGYLHRFKEFNFANDAVSASILPGATAVGTERELVNSNRVAPFKHLRISYPSVGHVSVNR